MPLGFVAGFALGLGSLRGGGGVIVCIVSP